MLLFCFFNQFRPKNAANGILFGEASHPGPTMDNFPFPVNEASNRGGKDIMNFYADIAGRSKDLTNLLKLPAYEDVDRDELMVIGSFANGLNKNNPRTLR